MKYVIIGAGGTGGCIGGYLAKAGCDVTLIARGRHLAAIKEKGLTIESSEKGSFTVSDIKACTMDEYNDKADVIFVCVKYYSIAEAIEFVKKAAHKNTVVIPILNVFGTGSIMQKQLENITVTDGCVYIYSFIKKYGKIAKPSDIFKVYYGLREGQDRGCVPVLNAVAEDLKKAGIEPHFTDDIKKEAFRKFTYVSPIGTAGLYCNAVGGDFVKEGEARETLIKLMSELLELGKAMGIEFKEDMIKVNLDILAGLKPDATTSMQRDVYSGGPSEAEGLIHQVALWGKQYGVPMPMYNKAAEKY